MVTRELQRSSMARTARVRRSLTSLPTAMRTARPEMFEHVSTLRKNARGFSTRQRRAWVTDRGCEASGPSRAYSNGKQTTEPKRKKNHIFTVKKPGANPREKKRKE